MVLYKKNIFDIQKTLNIVENERCLLKGTNL